MASDTGEKHLARCDDCEKQRIVSEEAILEHYDEQKGPPYRLILARCDYCRNGMLLIQEQYAYNEWDTPVRMWPVPPRRLDASVPRSLRDVYKEAQMCLENGSYNASVTMVRKAIEGVCADFGVKKPTLAKSIEELRDQNLIDSRLVDWADELRLLGNKGAHFESDVAIAKGDARDAMEFLTALLDYVYVFRAKFDQFKTRRAKP